MYIIFFLVSFSASIVGAICGIGGGVIIKPLLDACNVLPVSSISFLSGCTVLAMSIISVFKTNQKKGESLLDITISTPLAIGAAIGGILGKSIFQVISNYFGNQNKVGIIQAACLIIVTIGTLAYTCKMDKIITYKVKNILACIIIGLILGILSSFLGIGGGPINLVVLYFFFSMSTKVAAQNSIYIIMFSQITSLMSTILTKNIPEYNILYLILMVGGGLLGGTFGSKISKTIQESVVKKLFIGLMVVIIFINIYNIIRFTGILN